jgi:hypothetical protein
VFYIRTLYFYCFSSLKSLKVNFKIGVVQGPSKQCIVVGLGQNSASAILQSFEIVDLRSPPSTQTCSVPPTFPRSALRAIIGSDSTGSLFVGGGRPTTPPYSSYNNQCYFLNGGSWIENPDMKESRYFAGNSMVTLSNGSQYQFVSGGLSIYPNGTTLKLLSSSEILTPTGWVFFSVPLGVSIYSHAQVSYGNQVTI